MFKHLLIATDGSVLAEKAEMIGLELAKQIGACVTVVTATEPWLAMTMGEPSAFDFPVGDFEKIATRHATQILTRVSELAAKLQVSCETVHVRDFPSEAIIETARVRRCDLIIMASHGRRGLHSVLLGSQVQRVIAVSPVSVLVCH